MFFGPIVTLEMVTSSRRARYFIVRVLYAAVLLFVFCLTYTESLSYTSRLAGGQMSIRDVARFSYAFFSAFSFIQICAVLLLTPAVIAGSIAQERERRTIEYMLASTLTGGEIVLSKFLARTLQVATLLAVGLPILAIAMVLGGIDPQLLSMVFVETLATLLATAALSISTSVWSKRSRDAVVRSYVLLLAFLTLPPIAWLFSTMPGMWPGLQQLLAAAGAATWVNPIYVLQELFTSPFRSTLVASRWQLVGPMLVSYAVFSTAVLAWSVASVRRVYRRSIGASEGTSHRRMFRFRWRPAIGSRPMLWKELFAATAGWQLGIVGRIAVALLLLASVSPAFLALHQYITTGYSSVQEITSFAIVMCTILACGALLVVTIRASASITAEKERDTWLSLTSTILSPAEIILAKMAGSLFAARWLALPALTWILLATFVRGRMLFVLPIMLATYLCIALALSGLGIWFSSWCRTSIRAMASSVAIAVFLGGGYLLCCVPVMISGIGSNGSEMFVFAPCIPFLLGTSSFVALEFVDDGHLGSSDSKIVIACLLGTVAYLAVGLALAAINIETFDDRVGRPRRSRSPSGGRSAPWSAGAVAPPPPPIPPPDRAE